MSDPTEKSTDRITNMLGNIAWVLFMILIAQMSQCTDSDEQTKAQKEQAVQLKRIADLKQQELNRPQP